MNLLVLPGQRFSCHACTNCCRDWHVQLSPDEIQSVTHLRWPDADPLGNTPATMRIGASTFLAHKPGGACLFLNEENGRCRIHETFGADAKPMGCRLFPFHIAPTFPGEASVIGRFDCPTIRKNEGTPLEDQRDELQRHAAALDLSQGFDDLTACALDRGQITAIAQFVGVLLNAFADDGRRALFLHHFTHWLSAQQVGRLDRALLGSSFDTLRDAVEASLTRPRVRPSSSARLAFRSLLAIHLRRDEDVINRKAGRFRRTLSLTAFTLGRSSLHALNTSQPRIPMRRVGLFHATRHAAGPDTFALLWRLVRTRLESFQFMGAGNSGRNLIHGLHSLALLYPLSLAVARCHAAARDAAAVEPPDAEAGIAAIEHAFGRSPLLRSPSAHRFEKILSDPANYTALICSL